MTLHAFLDDQYGANGHTELSRRLAAGADLTAQAGDQAETPLHVATRRRRRDAVALLLDHGADIEATNAGGKTAYAHAVRRGFDDIANLLSERGADATLAPADHFAVAVVDGRLDDAGRMLDDDPALARTGNVEEDRLLADVAGRTAIEPVRLLIRAGADLRATGLDNGTALHQAACCDQPENARLLLAAGAPLDVFDATHASSPLGWAAHDSRYSGGATPQESAYVQIVEMLLDAGAALHYPGTRDDDAYITRLLADASGTILTLLRRASNRPV